MSKWRFFELWCAGYGLIWALMLTVALLGNSHIDAGEFGLFGFPVIALVYAFVRWPQINADGRGPSRVESLEREVRALQRRLERDPPY